jgi:mannose-6-phosphate isomerase-like protein (cupin superfamily)
LEPGPPNAGTAGVRHQPRGRPPGEQIPEHDEVERDQEEVFFILSGAPTLVIDGQGRSAPAGTFARLDPEHTRTVRNDTNEPVSVLIASAPQSSGYEPMEWN